MIFNTVIGHLRQWCICKAEYYQKRHTEYGGIAYVGYQVAYELEFKLLTLIDKSFENAEALKKEIMDLIDVHYEPSVINPASRTAVHMIDKTNLEFCELLERVLAENESLSPVNLPYRRVIIGSEFTAIKDKFRLIWQYRNNSYWFPLMRNEPTEIIDKFFIMFNRFEPYMKQMEQILDLPREHIYCYGESVFRPEHCIETSELKRSIRIRAFHGRYIFPTSSRFLLRARSFRKRKTCFQKKNRTGTNLSGRRTKNKH